MNVTAPPHPTGADTGQHRADPDPSVHIDALRRHVRGTGDQNAELAAAAERLLEILKQRDCAILRLAAQCEEAEHARDHVAADALAVRNYVRTVQDERDAAQRRALGLQYELAGLRRELTDANARVAELKALAAPRRWWSR